MKRKLTYSFLLLLVCSVSALSAQNISVSSFRLLENDLTANTHGTMEKDQNGEVAALIKIVTPEQGFTFDGGMVGITKVKQEVGEVWVYVPRGIKKITIKHQLLGVLRDYYFPIPIEKARTYEMTLTTGKVETIVTRSVNKQFVVFTVKPANASVELDGMPLEVDGEGFAEKSMAYGTYDYRVSCANYHTEAGKLTVSSQGKVEMNISLKPNFGWIEVKGASEYHGAQVYINGERIGQLPLKSGALKSGTYKIKVFKPLYKPFEQQVTVTDDNITALNVSLVPNFADITLVTDAESEIWIDGRQRGKGKCTIGLEQGEYTVEVKRPSHRTVSDVIVVSDLTARTIQLPSPSPIYGILEISSSPSRATVFVDGVEKGQTPLILENVLVGSRKVTLKKEGYESYEKTVMLKENADNTLAATLEEELIIVVEEPEKEEEIFQVVENQPEFPGGMAELMKYLQKNIKYPTICQEQGVQGSVIVQFVVNSDGSIVDPQVVKPVNPYLDKEALRVVSNMPKWKPGEQRGKKVRVRFTLPVTFRLSN